MPEKDEETQRPDAEDAIANLISHWKQRRGQVVQPLAAEAVLVGELAAVQLTAKGTVTAPLIVPYPEVLLQAAVVVFGDKTNEGQLIREVAIPWFEIIRQLEREPDFMFKIPSRKLEEIIAGAYERAGFPEVILTPRSGDRGRDIIATRPGIGYIRIIDEVKAYKPGHKVTAQQVRSVLGVLVIERNVTKCIVTTTSHFAPGIYKDAELMALVPDLLEMKDGPQLVEWLKTLLPPA